MYKIRVEVYLGSGVTRGEAMGAKSPPIVLLVVVEHFYEACVFFENVHSQPAFWLRRCILGVVVKNLELDKNIKSMSSW